MKVLSALLAALLVCLAGCSWVGDPPVEDLSGDRFLSRCYFQTLGFPFVRAGEEAFLDIQETVRSGGVDALDAEQQHLVRFLTESTGSGNARFTHMRRAELVELGVTTLPEFRQATGGLEYEDFMGHIGGELENDRTIELRSRYGIQIDYACDLQQEEFLTDFCAAGDWDACRRVDNLAELDPAIVAEACDLTPYMVFCAPETTVPWELPPLDEEQ